MTSRIGLVAASPLLISAAQATEHLAVDLDTAAHYVSAANGACGPHELDRAVDAVELHQPTVAPHLKGFFVLVTAYFANRHDPSLKKEVSAPRRLLLEQTPAAPNEDRNLSLCFGPPGPSGH
jgi:hypothetical protein